MRRDVRAVYICDPDKNRECRKKSCGYLARVRYEGFCFCTRDPEKALIGEDGKPMIYRAEPDAAVEAWKKFFSELSKTHHIRSENVLPVCSPLQESDEEKGRIEKCIESYCTTLHICIASLRGEKGRFRIPTCAGSRTGLTC